jgi:hypothetical protein
MPSRGGLGGRISRIAKRGNDLRDLAGTPANLIDLALSHFLVGRRRELANPSAQGRDEERRLGLIEPSDETLVIDNPIEQRRRIHDFAPLDRSRHNPGRRGKQRQTGLPAAKLGNLARIGERTWFAQEAAEANIAETKWQ